MSLDFSQPTAARGDCATNPISGGAEAARCSAYLRRISGDFAAPLGQVT